MSAWREVKAVLYQWWADGWGDTTRYAFANEQFDPQGAEHVRFRVQGRPSTQITLGRPGQRRVDRQGAIFMQIRVLPGDGEGRLSDLAEKAGRLFEARRMAPHDIRLETAQPGPAGDVDGGTWYGVTIEVPFAYQDII
jgi:hypothetical protein